MTECGFILVEKETGTQYRVCGCLQIFRSEDAANGHRKVFTSGDPDEWEAVPVDVTVRPTWGESIFKKMLPVWRRMNPPTKAGG